MCGIAGIINLSNEKIDKFTIEKMNASLTHRGPDEGGVYVDEFVGIGNRRLKILDLSENGAQPMSSEDGLVSIVYNGEIYNYKELKSDYLGDISFKGTSDTEVLLHMYLKFGYRCLQYLNGMFALAIWDLKNRILFCSRDRLGIKPFYYTIVNDKFIFGSEIKAILAAGVTPEPDYNSIYDYLVYGYYEHSNRTFFKNINILSPGHYMAVHLGGGQIKEKRYWKIDDNALNLKHNSPGDFYEGYKYLLFDAIKLRLRSDVPVGVNVSGGLDSCLLSVAIQEVTEKNTSFPLFCYGYDEEQFDEFPYAEKLGNTLCWPVRKFTLRADVVPELAESVMAFEEQPYPGIPCMAKHNCFRNLKDSGIKVVLSGHGGDETAGGYQYFIGSIILDFVKKFGWERAYSELKKYLSLNNYSETDVGALLLKTFEIMFKGQATSDAQQFVFHHLFNNDFLNDFQGDSVKFEEPFPEYSLNMQYRDLRYTKVPRILHNVDRASMSAGIEKRVPLLDHRLVEYSFSAPLDQRLQEGHLRFFMRKVATEILPNDLMNLPKRHSSDPQRNWFKNELAGWVSDILNSSSFKSRGIFNQQEVLKEFEAYKKRENPPTSYHIWQCIGLELWWRMFIDKKNCFL